MYYQLQVRKPKELLNYLIDSLLTDTFISFEGDLSRIQQKEHVRSTEEKGNFIRNTRTPKQNFWVFKLDNETKKFLKSDFLNRVGIRKNVIHVLAGTEDKIIFAAYDNFHQDCVSLSKSEVFNDHFILKITQEKIIKKDKSTSTQESI